MSETPNTNQIPFALPETNPGIAGHVPEAQVRHQAELERDRAGIHAGIENQFAAHQDIVTTSDTGAEVLTLQMPWQGGGAKKPEMATITLERSVDAAGSTQTDMTFAARHAWTSRARVVTVGGETRVRTMHMGDDGVLTPQDLDLDYEYLTARTWHRNLANPELRSPAPEAGRGAMSRFLGRRALRR